MSQLLESPKDYVLRILKTYPRLKLTFHDRSVDVNAITDKDILEKLANKIRGLSPEDCFGKEICIDNIIPKGRRSIYDIRVERANHELYVTAMGRIR